MEIVPEQIPNWLRRQRKLMRFTQGEVAQHLGLKSPSIISRWEHGVSLPNVVNLLRLSILYKTLADQLYYDLVIELRQEFVDHGVLTGNDTHYV